MVYLLNVLSDIAPKTSATFSIQICQNPKLQLDPTDSFYPKPPSSYDIATAKIPNSSVSSTWPCQLPIISHSYFGLTKIEIGITEMA